MKFAYATNGHGIIEYDYFTGQERELDTFPSPGELWYRFRAAQGLEDDSLAEKLLTPSYIGDKIPRYYQNIAINEALKAILQGQKRILLTMATGTGKTLAAFQICWKLWHARWNSKGQYRKPHILYLSDRNILVDDPEDLAELLNPQSWQEAYYSVLNGENELVGFFVFKRDRETVEVGLGLRPDLTGKGLGRPFLNAGLTFGQEHFSVEVWSLSVATFNTRAIHLYQQVGFTPLNTFIHHTNGGEFEFLRMVR